MGINWLVFTTKIFTEMDRADVDLNDGILTPLIGFDGNQIKYKSAIENFERSCEKKLIDAFSIVNICGLVKTDPYSLPYNKDIVVFFGRAECRSYPYIFRRVVRHIIKKLLEEDIHKVRFYLFINVITKENILASGVEYRFRYYHKE